jgi:hypothetical protein
VSNRNNIVDFPLRHPDRPEGGRPKLRRSPDYVRNMVRMMILTKVGHDWAKVAEEIREACPTVDELAAALSDAAATLRPYLTGIHADLIALRSHRGTQNALEEAIDDRRRELEAGDLGPLHRKETEADTD